MLLLRLSDLVVKTRTLVVSRAGKGSAVDERIALDGNHFRPPQVVLTVMAIFIFSGDPFAADEFLCVAAMNVPPISQPLVCCEDGRWSAAGFMQQGGDRSSSRLQSLTRKLHLFLPVDKEKIQYQSVALGHEPANAVKLGAVVTHQPSVIGADQKLARLKL